MPSRYFMLVTVLLAALASLPAEAACQYCTRADPWSSHCKDVHADHKNGYESCSDIFGCSLSGKTCSYGGGGCSSSDPDSCDPLEKALFEVPDLSEGTPWVLDSCGLPRQIIEA